MSHCVTSATCKRWRGGARGGFKAAFDAEVVHEIEALIAPGAADRLDFEAVETPARGRALEVAARAVEQRLNADHSDHADAPRPCPRCGAPTRYAGRRDKSFTSVLGELRVERAYYHCDGCAPRPAWSRPAARRSSPLGSSERA
ncbi:MAG: hypothetical protein AAB328_02710, partial [candidate division NC10 bacterium]